MQSKSPTQELNIILSIHIWEKNTAKISVFQVEGCESW